MLPVVIPARQDQTPLGPPIGRNGRAGPEARNRLVRALPKQESIGPVACGAKPERSDGSRLRRRVGQTTIFQ